MGKIYFLFSFLMFLLAIHSSEMQDTNLVVMDSKTKKENQIYLLKNVDESLELMCALKDSIDDKIALPITLSWYLSDQNRTIDSTDDFALNETLIASIQIEDKEEVLKLNISHLKTTDNGTYICKAHGNNTISYNRTVNLFVKPLKRECGTKMFECEENKCIAYFYTCDGYPDCKSKNDESPSLCGENPCEGKIRCSSRRCIPKEWCNGCDPSKMNCTNRRYKPECCQDMNTFPKGVPPPYGDGSYSRSYSTLEHHYDMKFIQTTIYTIIGCAIVFMVIVSILVIAICRVHMKRSPPTNIPNNRRAFVTTAYSRACTRDIDLDIALNRVDIPGLLVTYNINNGVQIVGSPVEPPPYSEVASLPPREGPPPPYTLSQPYDGTQNLRNVRLLQGEVSPKPGSRAMRHGLSHARVSSEPSLLNVNRL